MTRTQKHWSGPVLHPGFVDAVVKADPGLLALITTLLIWCLIALAVLVDAQL